MQQAINTLESVYLTALFLVGALFTDNKTGEPRLALSAALFARRYAGFRFSVEQGGFGCTAPLIGEGLHQNNFFVEILADAQGDTHADVFAGLDPLAIAMDFATVNRLLGQGACLKEARGPEPFIEADFVGFVGFERHLKSLVA